MLALHSGRERGMTGRTALVDKVTGLAIKKFWHSPDDGGEDIIEIVKVQTPSPQCM
jgi:hypothetical protein